MWWLFKDILIKNQQLVCSQYHFPITDKYISLIQIVCLPIFEIQTRVLKAITNFFFPGAKLLLLACNLSL